MAHKPNTINSAKFPNFKNGMIAADSSNELNFEAFQATFKESLNLFFSELGSSPASGPYSSNVQDLSVPKDKEQFKPQSSIEDVSKGFEKLRIKGKFEARRLRQKNRKTPYQQPFAKTTGMSDDVMEACSTNKQVSQPSRRHYNTRVFKVEDGRIPRSSSEDHCWKLAAILQLKFD